MTTKEQEEQRADQEKHERAQLGGVIGKQVMHALGRPFDLHRVDVRTLWDGHYRVNVLVGSDAASARVAHSYFLVADDAGNILASTPSVIRQY